jgi:hypothetical protein
MDIDHIIDALGGTNAVAAFIDRDPTVVSSWKRKGTVAHWWVNPLLERAHSIGVALQAEQIPTTPRRESRAA